MGSYDGVFEILLEISFVFFPPCLIFKAYLGRKFVVVFQIIDL